jgi:hypothetical protein
MVEEIPKVGDETVPLRIIVVGTEEGHQLAVALEVEPDPPKRIRSHLDVGVQEDEDILRCSGCTRVSGLRRTGLMRLIDDDYLLRWFCRRADRCEATGQRLRRIRRWNHHTESRHVADRAVGRRGTAGLVGTCGLLTD